MSVLSQVKYQGTLFPFLQEWGYYKELDRDQDEDPFFEGRKELGFTSLSTA